MLTYLHHIIIYIIYSIISKTMYMSKVAFEGPFTSSLLHFMATRILLQRKRKSIIFSYTCNSTNIIQLLERKRRQIY